MRDRSWTRKDKNMSIGEHLENAKQCGRLRIT